ncbi:MAG TPA: thiamine phosphate synthase [Xanthobacteraceae bacterium]
MPNNTPSPGARAQVDRRRLYLVTPVLEDPTALTSELEKALGAADVAAVLLRLADGGERTLTERAKAVAAVVQRHDVALVLDGRPEIAARAGADGAHLTGIQTFASTFAMLKPDRIAGAGGLRSRHDAMLAAETGADYVMFGDPDRHGRRPGFEELLERLTWWTELFEIPCVAYAASEQEIEALARTGADFIALGEWIWCEPNGAAGVAAAAAAKLAEPAV